MIEWIQARFRFKYLLIITIILSFISYFDLEIEYLFIENIGVTIALLWFAIIVYLFYKLTQEIALRIRLGKTQYKKFKFQQKYFFEIRKSEYKSISERTTNDLLKAKYSIPDFIKFPLAPYFFYDVCDKCKKRRDCSGYCNLINEINKLRNIGDRESLNKIFEFYDGHVWGNSIEKNMDYFAETILNDN